MNIATRDRTTLKSYFEHNDIPSEEEFEQLIDGMLNQRDDGIARPEGDALRLWSLGGDDSQRQVLKIYRGWQDTQAAWVLSLNPFKTPGDKATARPGLSIGTAAGESRLFIDQANGNVGVGTLEPEGKLHIIGGADVTLDGGSSLVLGPTNGLNVAFDENKIQARNNKQPAPLYLQALGGIVAAGGVVKANGGVEIHGNRAGHLEADGALYRHGGQVYLTVDDNFYIRDKGGEVKFHFQTNDGELHAKGGLHITGGNVTIDSGGSLVLGEASGQNVAFTEKGILATFGGYPGTLHLDACGGRVAVNGGLTVEGDVFGHLEADGAFYRHSEQVYLTVNDNFYIRQKDGDVKFHFQTDTGIIEQQDWQDVTYENGWSSYYSRSAQYYKDSFGIVHLRGDVVAGSTGTIFVLKEGYRPERSEHWAVLTEFSGTPGGGVVTDPFVSRLEVGTNGKVYASKHEFVRLTLDGISFRAA